MITKFSTQAPIKRPFNDLMNGVFGQDISQFLGQDDVISSKPSANITEEPNAFLIEFVVPGFSKEQLTIAVEKETVTISGETAKTELKEGERFTRREFRVRNFSRSFRMPETVDLEAINAELTHGILKVRIPRKETPTNATRQITIN